MHRACMPVAWTALPAGAPFTNGEMQEPPAGSNRHRYAAGHLAVQATRAAFGITVSRYWTTQARRVEGRAGGEYAEQGLAVAPRINSHT